MTERTGTSTHDTVDYIVVGSGTAGSVLAARLGEDNATTVAVLELGGEDTDPAIFDPGMGAMFSLWAPNGPVDWGYATTEQPGLAGRSIDIARGKVLGGSSAINAKIYIRGNRRDFDGWAAQGNTGWSYEEVLPYFLRSERYLGGQSAWHGTDGPISVIDYQRPSEATHAFVQAAADLGATERYNDFNGESQEAGAGFYQSTRTPDGARVTAASAFLRPAVQRGNVRLLLGSRVTRLVIEGGVARGVEYVDDGGVHTLHAEREVLVCAGAFESPKLLMLSGIGPADDLAGHGIGVVADLPGVGRNLQDHLLLGVAFECTVELDPPELLAEGGLFTWSDVADRQSSPDLQYFFGPVEFVAPQYHQERPAFTFAPILAQPQSRGTVTLASADPTDLARVDPQYLSTDVDLAVLEHGIRYARELVATSAFEKLRAREIAPGDSVTSSADLRQYIRQVAGTVWHPAGTCRMGADDQAVVDDRLRVRGIDRLRVVDASVMPRLVNGNPNAAIMMIAEKAADLIATS